MRYRTLILALVLTGLSVAFSAQAQPSAFAPIPNDASQKPTGETADKTDEKTPEHPKVPVSLDDAVAAMDVRAKITQLMFVTLQGSQDPNSEDLNYLRANTPGGVVIRHLLTPSHASEFVAVLRGLEQTKHIPFLIAGDFFAFSQRERGATTLFPQLPTPLAVAATDDMKCVEAWARLLAEQMTGMGFNLYLGPSLELPSALPKAGGSVYRLGGNPTSLADTADVVLKVFREHQLIPLFMGFPGGGANRTGNTPAVLLTPVPQLNDADLAPYLRALANGAPILHVGTTLVPTLDPTGVPACLSAAVLTNLLRGELKYDGVIVAGPMDSEDIVGKYDAADAAIAALNRGADMLYWNGPAPAMLRMVDHLAHAVDQGVLSGEVIDAALKRVIAFKHGLPVRKEASKNPFSSGLKPPDAGAVRDIERRSITLAQNRGQALPLRKKVSLPIALTGTFDMESFRTAIERHTRAVMYRNIKTAHQFGDIEDFEVDRVVKNLDECRTVVCMFGGMTRTRGEKHLVEQLKNAGVTVVVVLLGYPDELPEFTAADAVLLAYCPIPAGQETLNAVADVLMGKAPARIIELPQDLAFQAGESRTFNALEIVQMPAGRLPVTLSEACPVGLGLSYADAKMLRKVKWEFGSAARRKGVQIPYAFAKPGNYDITLQFKDPLGDAIKRAIPVTVR